MMKERIFVVGWMVVCVCKECVALHTHTKSGVSIWQCASAGSSVTFSEVESEGVEVRDGWTRSVTLSCTRLILQPVTDLQQQCLPLLNEVL